MEHLLFEYGVDIVLSGHVHSYERSVPVYNNVPNECGPIYLNLGDGGNYEGATKNWNPINASSISPSTTNIWSAFREGSFGIGSLEFYDSITANYSWHRHACESDQPGAYGMNFSDSCVTPTDNSDQRMLTSDSALIVRPSIDRCPNRYVSTSNSDDVIDNDANVGDSSSDGDNDNSVEKTAVIALSVVVGVLGAAALIMTILLVRASITLGDISLSSERQQQQQQQQQKRRRSRSKSLDGSNSGKSDEGAMDVSARAGDTEEPLLMETHL